MVKLSVVIPVYNVEPYLRECLDSIINQTFRETEIICINDGSTDSSAAILSEYASLDARIQVITQENRGLSAARNAGLDVATGKYIHFMDSDDLLQLNAYMELYSLAEQHNLDVVFFDASVIFENEELAEVHKAYTTTYSYLREQNYGGVADGSSLFMAMSQSNEYRTQVCMQFIRTDYLVNRNIRFYEGIYHEDQLFTFLCMAQADRVLHINTPFFIRRIRPGSIMTEEKNFNHLKGYLVCFTNILFFTVQENLSQDMQVCTCELLESLRNTIITIFGNMDGSGLWRESLSAIEQYIVKHLIIRGKSARPASKGTEKHIPASRSDSSDVNTAFEWQLQSIQNSLSYKIGRCITWAPRKLRGGFRCVRDHGVVYTLKYTLFRVFR